MQKFIELLKPIADAYAAKENLKVIDIVSRNERAGKVLLITLDGTNGNPMSLNECAEVTRKISQWIDIQSENPNTSKLLPSTPYTLEVSSMGADRPLKTATDFTYNIGRICNLQTKDKDSSGRKKYRGLIEKVTDDSVTLFVKDETARFTIQLTNIQKALIELALELD